jgi:hypothetical protein
MAKMIFVNLPDRSPWKAMRMDVAAATAAAIETLAG